jgi:hypothetical protein
MIRVLAILLIAQGLHAQSGQCFSLAIPGVYRTEFDRGGALKVTSEPIDRLEFRLNGPLATRSGRISVRIKGKNQDVEVEDRAQMRIARVSAAEGSDVLPTTQDVDLEVVAHGLDCGRRWTLQRTDRLSATETTVAAGGGTVILEVTSPKAPVEFEHHERERRCRFVGSVLRGKDLKRLTVNGTSLPFTISPEDGSAVFSSELAVTGGGDIVVEAVNQAGSAARWVIPVATI